MARSVCRRRHAWMEVRRSVSSDTEIDRRMGAIGGVEFDGHRFINRELSWLAFNDRVLQLAEEPGIPLLERVKFCAIASTNLDEFFQVRVAALKDQVAAGIDEPDARRASASQQLAEIAESAPASSSPTRRRSFLDELAAGAGRVAASRSCSWAELDDADHKRLVEIYEQRIFPVLTPLAVDPSHPFPYISNLALSLAAMVADPDTRRAPLRPGQGADRLPAAGRTSTAPGSCPSSRSSPPSCSQLFVGMVVEERAAFRVTRNADLTLEDEDADDLLAAVEMELRRRRFDRAVRLEVPQSDQRRDARAAGARARASSTPTCTGSAARSTSTCLLQLHGLDRAEPEGRAVAAGHGRPHRRRRGSGPQHLLGHPRAGDCWCTTRTRASPAAPRTSSPRRPTTRGCRASR